MTEPYVLYLLPGTEPSVYLYCTDRTIWWRAICLLVWQWHTKLFTYVTVTEPSVYLYVSDSLTESSVYLYNSDGTICLPVCQWQSPLFTCTTVTASSVYLYVSDNAICLPVQQWWSHLFSCMSVTELSIYLYNSDSPNDTPILLLLVIASPYCLDGDSCFGSLQEQCVPERETVNSCKTDEVWN